MDNLIRIAELVNSADLDEEYFETWNDSDYETAYGNWISFWMTVVEYVNENISMTTSFESPTISDGIDEESWIIYFFSEVFGISMSVLNDVQRTFYPTDSDLDQIRGV